MSDRIIEGWALSLYIYSVLEQWRNSLKLFEQTESLAGEYVHTAEIVLA